MSKNTGESFEKLTQEIYQSFCDFDASEYGIKKIEVLHDVKLKGNSGATHQIDVFWKFNFAGVSYSTIVEVKDWKTPVKKEQIMSFKAKIDDIPNSNGIFVSRMGFQEGAKLFAEHNGIQLVTITEDVEFKILLNFITTNYENFQVKVDEDDLHKLPNGAECLKKALYEENLQNLIVIKPDKYTEKVFDLMCTDAEPYYYVADNIRHHIEKDLSGDWYLASNKESFPLIKIYGYCFDCYNTSEAYVLTLKELPIVSIKNILNNDEHRYNKDTKTIFNSCHCHVNM
ncbi:MAG: restriction endonuclease [Ruminococcaceae bacterium]|nr:restriction endonuclease [Oscillospiraceae bacterium]